jgi:hypothetical protein
MGVLCALRELNGYNRSTPRQTIEKITTNLFGIESDYMHLPLPKTARLSREKNLP